MKKTLQKYLPVGALGVSLILHLAIFLGISGIIIIQAVAPKVIPSGEYAPPSADSQPEAPAEPEDLDVTPPSDSVAEQPEDAPPLPSFNIEQISSAVTVSAPMFTVAAPVAAVSGDSGNSAAPPSAGRGEGRRSTAPRTMANPFGGNVNSEDGAMIGHMYDLKQTADRQPTSMLGDARRAWNDPLEAEPNNECRQLLAKFIGGGWPESLFEKYYKVEKPVGIFQMFIPRQDAELAPKAFNAERQVKPRRWVIVYRGTFVASASGTYRFAGSADDELAVRLGQKVVLEVGCNVLGDKIKREPLGNNGMLSVYGGEWFELKEGQTYPLQILISEVPGGAFHAFLLIQKKGADYAMRGGKAERGPVLPVFQFSPVNLPRGYQPEGNAPTVAKEAFICQ